MSLRKELFQILSERFDTAEIKELCEVELDLAIDQFGGITAGTKNLAMDIIKYMERRGRLPELQTAIQHMRPDTASQENVSQTITGTSQEIKPAVYISYAWGGKSEEIVNKLDAALQTREITLIRDKRDLGFKGNIKAFMERIGRGQYIVVVLSKKYLQSENCMFELVEIFRNGRFHERIFPIVLSDANIYNVLERIEYIQYWETRINELNAGIKKLGSVANLQGLQNDINNYTAIRNTIDRMVETIKDMNALTPDMHEESNFDALYRALDQQIKKDRSE